MNQTTLGQQLAETAKAHPELPPELGGILERIAHVSKTISSETTRIALSGRTGTHGGTNTTGDEQKKMDVYSNEVVMDALASLPSVCAFVSEEMDEPKALSSGPAARYLVCADPFDGSSNTDINASVGTIFGVYRRVSSSIFDPQQDVFRPGSDQVASGYVLYGTSTMFVYTCGRGVHGFTLDGDVGEYVLTHPDIRCPSKGKYYSANVGNHRAWSTAVRKYIDYITETDVGTKRPYSLRYSGALVGDLHRILLEGGIFFYPADAKNKNGKLRYLYECAPLALIAEQAGGKATTGEKRILDIRAETAHQRVPLAIGSAEDVAVYERFSKDHAN